MPMNVIVQRYEVEYLEDIQDRDENGHRRYLGKRRMRGVVEIRIDLDQVSKGMGPTACRSKGGRCVDGHVVVKRVSAPMELSREMKPLT